MDKKQKSIKASLNKNEPLESDIVNHPQSSKINCINKLKKSILENNDKALSNAFSKKYPD